LAKHAEHGLRDAALALDCALRLRALAATRGATARQSAAIEHRIARLERRLAVCRGHPVDAGRVGVVRRSRREGELTLNES
jgi:hypothetical protein